MKAIDRDSIRDEVYHAIKKVMDSHRDKGTMSTLTTDSTELHMTNAAMTVLDTICDCDQEWKDNGYLSA